MRKFFQLNATSVLFLSILLPAIAVFSSGCNKDKEKEAAVGNTATSAGDSTTLTAKVAGDFSDSLITLAPDDSIGFVVWDSTTPGATKFLASQWSGTNTMDFDSLSAIDSSALSLPALAQLLMRSGLDLNDSKTMAQVAKRGVIFTAPRKPVANSTNTAPYMALVLESAADYDLNKTLESLKVEAEKSGYKVTTNESDEVKFLTIAPTPEQKAAAAAVSALDKDPSKPAAPAQPVVPAGLKEPLAIAWKNKRVAISNEASELKTVLTSTKTSAPALLSSPEFAAAVEGFAAKDERLSLGYLDVQKMLSLTPAANPAMSLPPVKAVAFVQAMDEAPKNMARVLLKTDETVQSPWLKVLNVSSSSNVLPIAPGQSMVYLSIDGKTIKQVKDLALTEYVPAGPQQDAMRQSLAAVDSISRYGIAAQMAPAGQSLLPVPDISVAVETSDSAASLTQLKALLDDALVAGVGIPATWTEAELNGIKIWSTQTPLGIAVTITAKKNLVIISTSRTQLEAIFASIDSGSFALAQNSVEKISSVLTGVQTLGTLYVNFAEIGKLMENMGGMLSMFVPASGNSPPAFSDPARIAQFKKMGVLVGTASTTPGAITFESFYRPAPAGVALVPTPVPAG